MLGSASRLPLHSSQFAPRVCKRGSTSATPPCLLYVDFQAIVDVGASLCSTHPPGVHVCKLSSSSVLPVTPARIAVPRSNNTAVFDFKAFAHPLKSTVTDICSLSFFWLRAPDSGSLARGLWPLAPSLPPLTIYTTYPWP